MSEREAILRLAKMIEAIAGRCWAQLGTDEASRLIAEARSIVKKLEVRR